MEEYVALLRITSPNPNKVFWKKSKKFPFRKKLPQMTNMDANVFVPITKSNVFVNIVGYIVFLSCKA